MEKEKYIAPAMKIYDLMPKRLMQSSVKIPVTDENADEWEGTQKKDRSAWDSEAPWQ